MSNQLFGNSEQFRLREKYRKQFMSDYDKYLIELESQLKLQEKNKKGGHG